MCLNKDHVEENWISLILRIAIGMLFVLAGYVKFVMGLGHVTEFILTTFKDTFLPAFLLVPYSKALPFAEVLAGLWLLTGFKLRTGWVFTSALLISLTFGLIVTKSQDVSQLYVYLLVSCAGLYVSRYDHCVLGGKK
jgi:thiosulfate dehydrogenase [quinone] large subunit